MPLADAAGVAGASRTRHALLEPAIDSVVEPVAMDA
jgi:hypothetical protein